jgi:hypothetical protein
MAGWLSITQAVIFPLAFVMSIVQGVIGVSVFHYRGPNFGPSDLLFIIFTAISVYTLTMFRKLLNERYNFPDIDTLIVIAIIWGIVFQITSLAVRAFIIALWPLSQTFVTIIYISFMTVFMVIAGIVDILIGVKLLKAKKPLNDFITAFAYIAVAAGILEATIVLSPLALILLPVSCVILGMVFLKEKEEAEFV